MQVIERGNVPEEWSCEQKCSGSGHGDGGCGSLLRVEAGDLFPGIDGATVFSCPLCAVWSALDGDVPANLGARIPFRIPPRL